MVLALVRMCLFVQFQALSPVCFPESGGCSVCHDTLAVFFAGACHHATVVAPVAEMTHGDVVNVRKCL
jgi:hypothetical protein